MQTLKYKKGYKYQTISDFEIELEDCPNFGIVNFERNVLKVNDFVKLKREEGSFFLMIKKGYAWDGATGAVDTENFMIPSLVHDAILETIGVGKLAADPWKPWIDKYLVKLCKGFGMNCIRRLRVYWAVRLLGDPKGSQPKEIFILNY